MAGNSNTTNLSPNIASALCYVPFVGGMAALILLIIEKNSTVKWHAAQALLLTVLIWVLWFVLPFTIILAGLTVVVGIVGAILQLFLSVKAYQGSVVKLPLLGDWADKIVKKV